ncbi:hypothetical protein C0991_009054 [Blastosporella zonata]|nr:hypothetical protein C0991_009054 [Blastosporella zonata]
MKLNLPNVCLFNGSSTSAVDGQLQVKRKWERIVNRGFVDTPSSSTLSPQTNGAVLEGIVEGVQGVGRFIAAGLAIGELSSTHPSPSVLSPPLHPKHSNSNSNSSVSTYTTKSTSFSQSSASSLAEDTASEEKVGDDELIQVLMVHDTGATPTMSPNPAFEHRRQQQQQRTDVLDPSAFDTPPTSSKLHRRRSRGPDLQHIYHPPEEPLPSSSRPSSPSAAEVDKIEAARIKRAALNGTSFPPISSIPGLAALTVGSASSPVPSWVGNVGKKWEELQRGSTFSKNQKRASVLLSDVSHTIVTALSSPPLTLSAKAPSPVPPSFFDPLLIPSRMSTSLLDQDEGSMLETSSILIPSPTPAPQLKARPKQDPTWQALEPSSQTRPISNTAKQNTGSCVDEEDEWNW